MSIKKRRLKVCWLIAVFVGAVFPVAVIFGQTPGENDTLIIDEQFFEADTSGALSPDSTTSGMGLGNGGFSIGFPDGEDGPPSFWKSQILRPLQVELKYEAAYKFTKPDRLRKNRFSFGLKYSNSLSDMFSLHLDTKVYSFLKNDHRARDVTLWLNDDSKDVALSFGALTREAYLQASIHNTSIKAGLQTLPWGESDFAAVTNEINPLDYREPLNLNIDELRFGQLMLTVDQYSPIGNWSLFFIPDPRFNQHPKEGTDYYYDPFNGNMEYQMEEPDNNLFEYGVRWKRTFGKSDISVMAASLIDNEYALRMVKPGVIARRKHRYTMGGVTFNHAVNKFLFKGELALKFPRTYSDTAFQPVERNALDASLGVDYSLSSSFIVSMEAVNYHIMDWTPAIQGMPENNYMLLFILSKQLMNSNLLINYVTMYNGPYSNFFNLLTTSYNWNDHLTLNLDLLVPITDDQNSGMYIYRNEKQLVLRLQYLF